MREGGEHLQRCRLVLRVEGTVGVVSMETKREGDGGSFYPYFYLSDQRFGTHSRIRVAVKYSFQTHG